MSKYTEVDYVNYGLDYCDLPSTEQANYGLNYCDLFPKQQAEANLNYCSLLSTDQLDQQLKKLEFSENLVNLKDLTYALNQTAIVAITDGKGTITFG